MANLGFLGLGLMGYPMARNLLKAGHEVALWSNSSGKAQKLAAEAGGKVCATSRRGCKTCRVRFHLRGKFDHVGDRDPGTRRHQ